MKFIVFIALYTYSFSQQLTFQSEIQERLDYSIKYSSFEQYTIEKAKQKSIETAIIYLEDEYGLILDVVDINLKGIILDDLDTRQVFSKYILTKNTIIREKLYVRVTLYIEPVFLMRKIKSTYKDELDALNYDSTKLKFEIDEIIKFRNEVFNRKKQNSDELLQVLRIGMLRQEVFNAMLYLNERKMEIDTKNSTLSEDKKKRLYKIKNSYIMLEFDVDAKRLTNIINNTPNY